MIMADDTHQPATTHSGVEYGRSEGHEEEAPFVIDYEAVWDINMRRMEMKATLRLIRIANVEHERDQLERARATSLAAALHLQGFKTEREYLARALLCELDEELTGGKIARLTGGLKIVWREHLFDDACGRSYLLMGLIELSGHWNINESRLRNTVTHEFCHFAAHYMSGLAFGADEHGEEFLAWGRLATARLSHHNIPSITPLAMVVDKFEFIWQCEREQCGMERGSHTKNVDPATTRCPCGGTLLQTNPIARPLRQQMNLPGHY